MLLDVERHSIRPLGADHETDSAQPHTVQRVGGVGLDAVLDPSFEVERENGPVVQLQEGADREDATGDLGTDGGQQRVHAISVVSAGWWRSEHAGRRDRTIGHHV
ncbi:hypothetical protein AB0G79_11485 [Streptomyces sp. NPDC020807]|uniref:hypothetical protein n=1 Tax=Streptomyces sp. NPDC020807 TaxID=3155119 RepID=UPI0033FA1ED4